MPGPLDRITGALGSVFGRGGSSDASSETEEDGWVEPEPEAVDVPETGAQDEVEDSVEAAEPEEPAQPEEPAAPVSARTGGAHSHRTEAERIQQDEGLPTAPSIGPHAHIDPPVHHQSAPGEGPSDLDAMGLDKRRSVVGGSYSPTRTRIVATFATFFAVVAVLAVGFFLLAKELDQAPDTNPDEAPWSAPDAPQNAVPKLQ